jgi:hypothetical protein
MQPNDPQLTIELRFRTIFTLWFAICMSVAMLLVLVKFTPRPFTGDLRLSLILNSIAVVPVGVSFLLKQQILGQAVARQRIDLVQVAYVLACALCEAAALFGLMDHFVNGSRYCYVGFIFAGVGLLLNFPRKQHLLDASQQQF